jgi:hypothetical protein
MNTYKNLMDYIDSLGLRILEGLAEIQKMTPDQRDDLPHGVLREYRLFMAAGRQMFGVSA